MCNKLVLIFLCFQDSVIFLHNGPVLSYFYMKFKYIYKFSSNISVVSYSVYRRKFNSILRILVTHL